MIKRIRELEKVFFDLRPSTFYLFYNLLLPFGILVYFLYAWFFKKKKVAPLNKRLGKLSQEQLRRLNGKSPIWIQAVSVGEIASVIPLIQHLRRESPDQKIVLTTTTPKGLELARRYEQEGVIVTYFPLDLSWSMKRFIEKIAPSLFIMVESEFWPNCIAQLAEKKIPMAVINGRISSRALRNYLRFRWIARELLSNIHLFCLQSENDKKRLIGLGISQEKIQIPGNLKFDADGSAFSPLPQAMTEHFKNRPVWVTGSSHNPEEKMLSPIFQRILKDYPNLVWVLAPRHIERVTTIEQWLTLRTSPIRAGSGRRISIFRWSQYRNQPVPLPSGGVIFLIDTIGELSSLYVLATVVFIGGSLIPHGGQNPLEAARLGKPILFGPYFFNFQDIQEQFLNAHAAIQAQNVDELESSLRDLLANPAKASQIGNQALRLVEKNQGATERVLALLKSILEPPVKTYNRT